MPAIDLTDDQAIALISQLPAERRLALIHMLARLVATDRNEQMRFAENRARELCRQRGLDWDGMDDDARQAFIDDLVHEDRQCCE